MNQQDQSNHLRRAVDRTPPFLVYYLAHDSKAALSHPGPREIAKRSGLSESTVIRLSKRLSWCHVATCTIDSFCTACGSTIVSEEKTRTPHGVKTYQHTRYHLLHPHRAYLKSIARGKYQNQLRHLSPVQRKKFDALCEQWAAAQVTAC